MHRLINAWRRSFYEAFDPERATALARRLEFCYTPKHGSWLNVAENVLSSLTKQCVSHHRLGDVEPLRAETAAWCSDVSARRKCVDWQFNVKDARIELKSVYPTFKS